MHHANRDNRRRPIFWQHGSARLEFDVAMRKSRQPRCTAAIFGIAASGGSKLLDAARNFAQAIFWHRRWHIASAHEGCLNGMKLSKACPARQ
jgi:hypothetical protein